ncbi:hypothetical protein ACNS7O_04615 [Haloferacaceae archaeon DSL9]
MPRRGAAIDRLIGDHAEKVRFLDLFGDGDSLQIPDPHAEGPAAFASAYDAIGRCVDTLLEARNESLPDGK